jgi:copper chaperone
MAEHNYKFDIAMSCGGCSGAVERVLKKLDGASTPKYRNVPGLFIC